MSDDELRARERELADELFHLRLRRATSQLANPMKVRETRRDLARVQTVLQQRAPAPNRGTTTGEAGAEAPSRPTGSGGIGAAQRAKRASSEQAPRRNK